MIPSNSDIQSNPSSIGVSSQYKSSMSGSLDFSFFGVYDGHGGTYSAEVLQNELHSIFEARLQMNNSFSNGTATDPEDELHVIRSLNEVNVALFCYCILLSFRRMRRL